MYTIQEANEEINGITSHYITISKIDYNSCPTSDSTSKCSSVEQLNMISTSFGTDYRDNNKIVGMLEAEGISIYNGKVYLTVSSYAHKDLKRYNSVLLIDNF